MSRRCLICANINPCRLHSEADQDAELARNDREIARIRGEQPADPSPWHPEADPQRLKVLGKLAEEANELGAALARCIIQGIDEAEPVTGKVNRVWLEDEIADVMANISIATRHFGLDQIRIDTRRLRKAAYIQRWVDGLTRPEETADVG